MNGEVSVVVAAQATSNFQPVFQLRRGETIESIHYGAAAVVRADGKLLGWIGDPRTITFLRSSAKPFQVLPFLEAGGKAAYGLSEAEIALLCASHAGSDAHVATVQSVQAKAGLREDQLLCGVHEPYDRETARSLRARGEAPTPNRHNCSGKHTGMLAYARLRNWSTADYIHPDHPLQGEILRAFAEMCGLEPGQVAIGTDGCSAPNFAAPLYNVALAYARLSQPDGLPEGRSAACRQVVAAMTAHPTMVAGPGRFDTRLMEVAQGWIVAKGGAEGYQGVGLLPGLLGPSSPGVGIALKISDGDSGGRARPAVTLEILRQLGALDPLAIEALAEFGPSVPLRNFRDLLVGVGQPCFVLK